MHITHSLLFLQLLHVLSGELNQILLLVDRHVVPLELVAAQQRSQSLAQLFLPPPPFPLPAPRQVRVGKVTLNVSHVVLYLLLLVVELSTISPISPISLRQRLLHTLEQYSADLLELPHLELAFSDLLRHPSQLSLLRLELLPRGRHRLRLLFLLAQIDNGGSRAFYLLQQVVDLPEERLILMFKRLDRLRKLPGGKQSQVIEHQLHLLLSLDPQELVL
jgi:hypothetical protein